MVRAQCLFIAANLAYFVLLDKVCWTFPDRFRLDFLIVLSQTTVMMSNTIALDFGRAVFGGVGAAILTATVAFSCFGAMNSKHQACFFLLSGL